MVLGLPHTHTHTHTHTHFPQILREPFSVILGIGRGLNSCASSVLGTAALHQVISVSHRPTSAASQ